MPRSAARPALILLAFIAFVSLGLPDTLLGVAWPSMRDTFNKPIDSVKALLAFGTAGYFCSSFVGGAIMKRIGVGTLLAGSCALVSAALAIYAISPTWPLLFLGALLGGIGAGAIDAGINAFGAKAFSARVLNWLHGCWGLGATLGPLVMTQIIAAGASWRYGYMGIGITMLAMTFLFASTTRMWRIGTDTNTSDEPHESSSLFEAMSQRVVQAQTLFFFVYSGVEFGAGIWLYTLLHESRSVSVETAGLLVAGFWAALSIGRLVFGQVAATVAPTTILRIGLAGALLAIVLLARPFPSVINGIGTLLLGFSLAPLYPTVISLTPQRVGSRFAAHAVSFQVSAAAFGITVLPGIVGIIARRSSIEVLPYAIFLFAIVLLLLNEWISRTSNQSARRVHAQSSNDSVSA